MKIEIPKIIQTIQLSDYAPEFAGEAIDVWVNPPRAKVTRISELISSARKARERLNAQATPDALRLIGVEWERISEEMMEWYAEIWSQGPDPARRVSVEDVKALAKATVETDPRLFMWLQSRTLQLIVDHRTGSKKG